jgi:Ca2+-binding RTX toxin-like protein
MTAMNGAPGLILAGGALVAALAAGGTVWANSNTCTVGVNCIGTSGPDELQGTASDDSPVAGLGGNDTVYGGRGADKLFGDDGPPRNDDGNDQVYGGPGADTLTENGGSDLLVGGDGNDIIWALGDKLASNPGEDTVKGGKGNDFINSVDGYKDTVDCGRGTDDVTFDKNLDKVAGNCEKQHPV